MASLRRRLAETVPNQILVIRTDRVGDLILSTPFLGGLREGFPQAKITALVAPYCREVLADSKAVDQVVTELPRRDFDLAIALAPRSGSWKLAYQSRAPVRLGYAYPNRPLASLASKYLLTHRELVSIKPPFEVPHEVRQLDLLARRLGLPSTVSRPLCLGIDPVDKTGEVVFHLGDRWLAGSWSFQDVKTLLRRLSQVTPVTVTAGPREVELLASHGLEIEGVRVSQGRSFREWAETIARADLLISPDTGAVHLAAAVGTPVIVAYEASTYEHCSRQWSPWMVESRSLIKGDPASTIEQVLAALEELVSQPGNRLSRATPGDFEVGAVCEGRSDGRSPSHP